MNEATVEADDLEGEPGDEAGAAKEQRNVESLRYPRRHQNIPIRFGINPLPQSRNNDQPSPREVLNGKYIEKWRFTMETKVLALHRLDCWEEIKCSESTKVPHTKCVLRRKTNQDGDIEKYKARLVLYGNEEDDNNTDCFSPVADYTLIKLLIQLAVQNNSEVKRYDFQSAFLNRKLDRSVYVKLPRQLYTKQRIAEIFMKPLCSS